MGLSRGSDTVGETLLQKINPFQIQSVGFWSNLGLTPLSVDICKLRSNYCLSQDSIGEGDYPNSAC
jgi:hypothetical protein